jgi:hypothetical protein
MLNTKPKCGQFPTAKMQAEVDGSLRTCRTQVSGEEQVCLIYGRHRTIHDVTDRKLTHNDSRFCSSIISDIGFGQTNVDPKCTVRQETLYDTDPRAP